MVNIPRSGIETAEEKKSNGLELTNTCDKVAGSVNATVNCYKEWIKCDACRGSGCELCNYKGGFYL